MKTVLIINGLVRMGKHKTIEQWKEELVGKHFGHLLVEDIRVNKKALCLCDCGNKKEVSLYHLLDGHTISCGCYNKSEEKAKKYIEWCKNNPDKVKEKGERHSNWFEENPERKEQWKNKIKESCNTSKFKESISDSKKQFYKDHPEVLKIISEKNKKWCSDNPYKVKLHGDLVHQWYVDNPDLVRQKAENYSEWCKENPELIKIKSDKHAKWCEENKEKILNFSKQHIEYYQDVRRSGITEDGRNILKNILSDIDFTRFCNGELTTDDVVVIKCSGGCGTEISVRFGNLFILARNELKRVLPKCNTCRTASSYEYDIANYISNFYKGECIRNSRAIIPPYELDLYYPEKKIAIEINGYFWHSTLFKHRKFHYIKWKYCKDHGIRLISIFEQDIINNKDKIYSFLKDTFSIPDIIYARKCIIKKVSIEEKRSFLEKYHIDGDSNQASISYGLFHNGTLLSVMCFGKLRGQNSLHNKKDYFELVRYVTKTGIRVIGGASRLFHFFISEYNPFYILSYSDNDFFVGDLYNKLGFVFRSYNENSIDYQWVGKYGKMLNRQETMVNKLLKKFPEYKNMKISGSKEDFIMSDLGYLKVYRCGNTSWVWCSDPS